MTDQQSPSPFAPLTAKIRQPRKISPFWLLPLVAFAIGCLLFFQILQERGEMITIRFKEGDGITAGKTAVRYQGLQIGSVKKVNFANGLTEVEVSAEINPEAKAVLREGTKFWLVKPSASIAGVSGLDTLVSGNYITLLPGDGGSENEFVAESEPPAVTVDDGDLLVRLVADDLGSIGVGASVYYRKVPVGNIADYRFTPDSKKVEIDVVINAKYAALVKSDSRFWNISGISAEASLSGVKISMDSLMSMVQGAVAFDSPEESSLASQGQTFPLFHNISAAKRGTEVVITTPNNPALKVNETAVYYQNLQIGVLSNLEPMEHQQANDPFTPQQGIVKGKLLIDPNHSHLLRTGSQIIFKEPTLAFNKQQLSKMGELLRGSYFELVVGEGEPSDHFNVQTEADYLLSRPNLLAIHLTAPQSYSVDSGQGIYYNSVQIGEILNRDLGVNGVTFKAVIFPPYRHLIHAKSKFVAISQLDVAVGIDGMRVKAGSPSDWLLGGVRVIAEKGEGEAKKSYPLYKDVDSAEANILTDDKTVSLTLSASELSGIDKGSVLLYRNFPIGEVLKVRPQKNKFDLDLYVEPNYRNLIGKKSRFWIEPAVQVDLSMRGLNVQAAPLMRSLKGAISVDNNGRGDHTLYPSLAKASSGRTYITLLAKDASKLSKGMAIKYMGLTVGEVESLRLEPSKKEIKATAYIEGQYYPLLARTGSQFNAVSPEMSSSGMKNLDAMFGNYIDVQAGNGKPHSQFMLGETDTVASQYQNGFPIILETSDANGIVPEAPVLYRGIEVGVVQKLAISELGDRVLIYLKINPKYKRLVRRNSEFWQASGYTMDISLSGASLNSGTMSQLLKGGIAFSTPSGTVVQPQARANQRFLLQRKMPDEAKGWDMGVAE